MTKCAIVIPARLASTRFPRKLLHSVRGKPIILWTAERVASEAPEFPLYFAVEDQELVDLLNRAGYESILTRADHASGTDRIAEAAQKIDAENIINVQADEPLVTGKQIRTLANLMDGSVAMATMATPFRSAADFKNPNKVKVILDSRSRAIYFSRLPIPYVRDSQGEIEQSWIDEVKPLWHLGLYAYSINFLNEFSRLSPGKLEQIEKLEQLRALENGHSIAVGITDEPNVGIDTPEDIAAFEIRLK